MDYFLFFGVPFILSLVFTPLVRQIALKNGLVSYPRPDRWHKRPTALLGGISIYLASVISALFFGLINKNALGLLLGATFLFIVGLTDDKFHLMPYAKLFAQIIAGCIAILSGVIIGLPLDAFLSIPLTLLWIIGITNSFNLLDNIDGLAAGISVITSLMLFASSLLFSNNILGVFALILAGAALGFLPYNFNPARIFMGDSGSMFLGYCIAVISISGTPRHISSLLITLLVPVFILSVPIFDTIFVMFIRQLQGRRIFEGGKDHTSHRLVTLGLSQRKTVLLLYAISIIFGAIGILYSKLNIFIISIIAFLGIVVLMFFGLFLFEGTSYKSESSHRNNVLHKNNKTLLNAMLFHKRRIVEVLLDFIFICIAYYSAYFLRFEGQLLTSNLYLIKESLVWLILIKVSVFFIFGLYRGVWRYIGISDFFTIFKVVTLSSVASILFLTFNFRFKDYSRAVFFMDWLILLFLILGSRFMFRILGEFLSRIQKEGKRVLVFGAGDMGEMVIREIKRNKSLNYVPVGFVDDDPHKLGSKIHGLPVLGSREKIQDLIRDNEIREVIIAVAKISMADFIEIAQLCKDCGVEFRRVKGILDEASIIECQNN
ncbi:MAG: hypothetical protein FJZ11_00360 [Candidatus Omnitrophica bacterium]|nr:hypothetical protein [Candidatus Omnitrophota bacterium]